MLMYSIYNLDTVEKLIHTVHRMYNKTTWIEKLFLGLKRHRHRYSTQYLPH